MVVSVYFLKYQSQVWPKSTLAFLCLKMLCISIYRPRFWVRIIVRLFLFISLWICFVVKWTWMTMVFLFFIASIGISSVSMENYHAPLESCKSTTMVNLRISFIEREWCLGFVCWEQIDLHEFEISIGQMVLSAHDLWKLWKKGEIKYEYVRPN